VCLFPGGDAVSKQCTLSDVGGCDLALMLVRVRTIPSKPHIILTSSNTSTQYRYYCVAEQCINMKRNIQLYKLYHLKSQYSKMMMLIVLNKDADCCLIDIILGVTNIPQ